ncbi:xanthan biosynthesis protein XanB [Arenimonas maotaiensis]|uniref:Xanthan biosynthesis protein XanB n=1 Tax=Arenimonas maotaiensis TaxID=1446479 RepID=A0A917CF23_9GAMM|nr:mannose-1-phosphate guanylyltransferase/mannose-6-phosphate isomerase [Arenimonas maotaiensis]GGF86411.1 xanthan biosynthesis protein XanB [Arenimonas maotaiensis]
MASITPVILSGGSGTRLWPLSREAHPKQFLPVIGEHSLLQATALRLQGLDAVAPIVVAGEAHRFLVAEQLHAIGLPPSALLLEPVGRNTAPAIAVAAFQALAADPDAVLLVMPSDHAITDVPAFQAAVRQALPAARDGGLVTFGIVPEAPETGFGYIKAAPGEGVRAIERFVEKPDAATAAGYVASGDYFWNSGMFLFRARAYLDELAQVHPLMVELAETAVARARRDADFIRLDPDAFSAMASDSIDYAVMEKTAEGRILPVAVGWSDVGSWQALWQVAEQDGAGNAHHGDVLAIDCQNSLAMGEKRLLALLGLDNVVVVDTDDAVLVAHKDRVQDVKSIVAKLKAENRPQATWHRKVFRPWGNYDSVDAGARFQVKRIVVKPGAALSLQMHHHRAEHWIVVSGTARVTCDERVILLSENQSTYIPLGSKHRLENPGTIPLELIEVQSGSYLGEDDIVRFEDVYGRTPEPGAT